MVAHEKDSGIRNRPGYCTRRLTVLLMLLGAAGAVSACDLMQSGASITGGHRFDDPYSRGDVVLGWQDVRRGFFGNCAAGAKAEMEFTPTLRYAEDIDGVPTFYSPNGGGLGVQIYIEGHGPVGAGGARVSAAAEWQAAGLMYAIIFEVSHRIVALRTVNTDQSTGYMDGALAVDDLTFGHTMHSLEFDNYSVTKNTYTSCGFTSTPGDVTLPSTHTSVLRNEGDMGKEQTFSFGWSCSIGNVDGESQGGDFYLSSPNGSGTDGRLATDGSAKGVDMLVTLTDNKNNKVPALFDRDWYSNHSGFSVPGEGVGVSGTQQMQVRFIRNSDPLSAGDATAEMTIHLDVY